MDEAVIRILMQDAGPQRPAQQVPGQQPQQPSPQPQAPSPPQQRTGVAAPGAKRPGDKPETNQFDEILKIADSLRGTIGGLAGTIVGSALDAVMAYRKMQVEAQKEQTQAAVGVQTLAQQQAASIPVATAAPQPATASTIPYIQETTAAVRAVDASVKALAKPKPPVSQTKAAAEGVPEDTRDALKALGMSKAEANKMVEALGASGQKFGSVQEALSAAMRIKQGLPTTPAERSPVAPAGSVAADVPTGSKTFLPVPPSTGYNPSTSVAYVPKGGGAGAVTGAGGEAMSGLAAAAGPAAIAIAAVEAYKAVVDGLVKGTKAVIGVIGSFVQGLASPGHDPAVPLAAFGDATTKAGEKIAYQVPILGIFAVAVGESTKALAGLTQNLDKTAERYGEFSPDIAVAQALADVRLTMGDLRRAQTIGPELARFVDARAALQDKIEDLKVSLMTHIVPIVTRILQMVEKGIPVLEVGLAPLVIWAEGVGQIVSALESFLPVMEAAQDVGDNDPTTAILRGYQAPGSVFGVRTPGV